MKEVWKPISRNMYYISAMVGTYEVSNLGRIRNRKTGKIIHPFLNQKGTKLKWTNHGKYGNYNCTLQFLVDHTVYETFIGDCYNTVVKHRDGNNMNNAVDNLYI